MDYAERHPDKDYLSSYDLIGIESIPVLVTGVRRELIKGSQKKAKIKETVIEFYDMKPMVLNITNDKMIMSLTREGKAENWVGRVLTIFAEEGFHFGKNMYGLRVKHCREDVDGFLMAAKNQPDFKTRHNLLKNKPTTEVVQEIVKRWKEKNS